MTKGCQEGVLRRPVYYGGSGPNTTVVNRALGHLREGNKPFSCKSPAEPKLDQRNPVREYGTHASLTFHAFTDPKWLSTSLNRFLIAYKNVRPF